MNFCKKTLLLSLIAISQLCFAPSVEAKKHPDQGPRLTVQQYCDIYAKEAQEQMRKHRVPASITLAQGILESGWGASYLAVVGNNHFGIKAKRIGWEGEVVYLDDDEKDEAFCKFPSVLYGYEYHSLFLHQNPRYAGLFKLDIRDYESWAHGLQDCHYATSNTYASSLISLIERYHLDIYDILDDNKAVSNRHKLYVTSEHHGLKYIRCMAGDDLAALAYEFGMSERKLRNYNDMVRGAKLKEGDIIYLQRKHKKADKGYETHVVRPGESMLSISQLYGVRVNSLMKRNKLVSATVYAGQVLKLR